MSKKKNAGGMIHSSIAGGVFCGFTEEANGDKTYYL